MKSRPKDTSVKLTGRSAVNTLVAQKQEGWSLGPPKIPLSTRGTEENEETPSGQAEHARADINRGRGKQTPSSRCLHKSLGPAAGGMLPTHIPQDGCSINSWGTCARHSSLACPRVVFTDGTPLSASCVNSCAMSQYLTHETI